MKLTNWQKEVIKFVVVFIVGVVFFSTVIRYGTVPSESMSPTLQVGDLVIANGLAYLKSTPERGDIVIFKNEASKDETYIKRIVGLPGDDLMFIDGYLYFNGELLYEEYLEPDMETNSEKDFIVPEGCYFVMGDNRENSYDSRFWDNPYITLENIEGKMITSIPTSRLISILKNLF